MSSCTWILSERSDRWRRAVDAFAPAILGGGFGCLAVAPGDIPEAVAQHRVPTPLIVLYELPLASPRETLAALVHCAALETPPLQLVALAAELPTEGRGEIELTAALRQLGAGALLRHPEDLPRIGRLVARYVHERSSAGTRRL